jgi:hypothetical protein
MTKEQKFCIAHPFRHHAAAFLGESARIAAGAAIS